jgi:hypothetical protein
VKPSAFSTIGHQVISMLPFAFPLIWRLAAIAALLGLTACSSKNQTVEGFDKAIAELAQPSANWQATVSTLGKSLPPEGKLLIGADLERLMQKGLASSPPDGRCDANLIRDRVRQELSRMRVKMDASHSPPIVQSTGPVVCEPLPAIYELERCVRVIELYGHDLDTAEITATVRGKDGRVREVDGQFAGTSGNLQTLDASLLRLSEDDDQIAILSRQTRATLAVIDVAAPARPPRSPPVQPASVRTVEEAIAHVDGKSFGENRGVTYGRKCSPGFHRAECSVRQLNGSGQCEPAWVDPGNESDCRCRVQFKLPAFESVDCRVKLTERANLREQPAPRKVVCG